MLVLVWEEQASALATVQTQHSWVVASFQVQVPTSRLPTFLPNVDCGFDGQWHFICLHPSCLSEEHKDLVSADYLSRSQHS